MTRKLTKKDERLIYEAYQNGHSYEFLAFKYGISKPTVLDIVEKEKRKKLSKLLIR